MFYSQRIDERNSLNVIYFYYLFICFFFNTRHGSLHTLVLEYHIRCEIFTAVHIYIMQLIANVFISLDWDCKDLVLTSSFNSFLLLCVIHYKKIDLSNVIIYDIIYESNLVFDEVTVQHRPFNLFVSYKTYVLMKVTNFI